MMLLMQLSVYMLKSGLNIYCSKIFVKQLKWIYKPVQPRPGTRSGNCYLTRVSSCEMRSARGEAPLLILDITATT